MATQAQVPAATGERAIVYQAADGQEVKLSYDIVKKYLVQGKADLVTMQEFMYFMNICKARKLNPLVKDCYLIKYGAEPAAIVTSIDFFRKRARAQKDCKGWKKGVLVKTKDGQVRDSYGLVMDDETLVGGWFEATPEGWLNPFRLEVNLKGYLKKTSEGKITKFWQEENQPTMIAKVVESQGLRMLWPDEFQQLYEEAEVSVTDGGNGGSPFIDVGTTEPDPAADLKAFEESIPKGTDLALLDAFVAINAKNNKTTPDNVRAEASKRLAEFWKFYGAWAKQEQAKANTNGKKEKAKAEATEVLSGACPNNGDSYKESFCAGCPDRAGCPAWS